MTESEKAIYLEGFKDGVAAERETIRNYLFDHYSNVGRSACRLYDFIPPG